VQAANRRPAREYSIILMISASLSNRKALLAKQYHFAKSTIFFQIKPQLGKITTDLLRINYRGDIVLPLQQSPKLYSISWAPEELGKSFQP